MIEHWGEKFIALHTLNTSYVLGISDTGLLVHLYYGKRISGNDTTGYALVWPQRFVQGTAISYDQNVVCEHGENYFYGDAPGNMDKLIYEISFFFLMKVPDSLEPISMSFTEDESPEHLLTNTQMETRQFAEPIRY